MIYTIGYIRGLASLFVMLFHFKDYLNDVYVQKNLGSIFFGSGSVGVDIFFIISGFIIVYSTRKEEASRVKKFALRRVFRIYPLLIFSVLVFSWITPEVFSFNDLLRAIVPLNRNFGDVSPYFGFNVYPPAWTIMFEVFFYVVFMLSMLISHKYRSLIASICMVSIVFGVQLLFDGAISLDAHKSISVSGLPDGFEVLKLFSSPMLLEFVFGMIIANIYINVKDRRTAFTSKASSFYLWLCLGLFVTFWFSSFREGGGPINYGIWALTLIPAALIYEKYNDIKPNKVLLFLGDISYSLYMVHIIVPFFLGYKAHWDPLYLNLSGIAKLAYVGTLCIASAYIIHVCIEKPMIRLSRKIISRI